METSRVVVTIAAASLLSAGLLAWVSRSPAEVRTRSEPPGATDAANGSSFTDEQIARHGAYRAPGYVYLALSNALTILVLVLLAGGPFARLLDRFEWMPGGWLGRALLAAVVVTVALWIVGLPLGFVRGYAMEKAWGLSTQDAGGWISDQLRATAVGLVMSAIAAIAFYGVVRWQPQLWWVTGWLAFTLLSVALTVLWPILIAPLFNRFVPLEDVSLRQRALSLAESAGIDVDRVLVSDASRRTSTENAYVAGLGATKQLVLYDNLVRNGDEDAAAFVIAHELGHRVERHVAKNVAIAAVGLLLAFAALRGLAGVDAIWTRASAAGVGDPRGLPVVMLFALVAGLLALPVQSAISRSFEERADEIALELTEDPSTAVRTFRRLAFANLADLRPHPLAVALLYSHPPIPDRIDDALSEAAESP